MISWLLFSLVVLGVAFFLTWALRRYALARSLIDVPNARSSHSVPTPRGGGVAIVSAFRLALVGMLASGTIAAAAGWALCGAGP
ncbi:MAG: glycosyl transferase, partial [Hafnia sp.]